MYVEFQQTQEKEKRGKWRAALWSYPAGDLPIATWGNMDKRRENLWWRENLEIDVHLTSLTFSDSLH